MAHIHSKVAHIYKLDKCVLNTSTDPKSVVIVSDACYELKSLGSDNRTTLVLSNTRELDRVPSTK